MKKVYMYTDGGSRGNPGPSGAGVFVCDEKGKSLMEIAEYLGKGTNNYAEYQAVLIGLQTVLKKFGKKTATMQFEVRMDSELVMRQLTGVYRVKDIHLKEYYGEIKKLCEMHFPHITFVHVRREQNKEADRLANEAMDRGV